MVSTFQVYSSEVTQTGSKVELPFLHATHCLDIYIPNKNHQKSQRGWKLWSAQGFPIKIHSREITQTGSMGEQPFLYTTHHFDQTYMPTKYYQNISKGINAMELIRFPHQSSFKGDNSRKQGRVIFLHVTHCLDPIYMLTKYNQNS